MDTLSGEGFFMKKRAGKSHFLFIITVVSLLFAAGLFWYQQKKHRDVSSIKNVVLINIDGLRADYMGAYGSTKHLTPFLDSLCAKGVVFEQAIIPSYLTFQTDAAILSGLYPSQNNVRTWDTPINGKLPLLPGILKLYNYKTAALVNPSMWEYFGWNTQFDSYETDWTMRNIGEEKNKVQRMLTNSQQPFFFFWHIYDLHQPYMPPSAEFFPGVYDGPLKDETVQWKFEKQTKDTWFYLDATTSAQTGTKIYAPVKLTEQDRRYLQASYETGIRSVDEELRLFFQSIRDTPIYKNTLFIISSEHGEDMNEHGFIFHRDLYDVNIRVPLVFLHQSLKPRRVKEAVSSLDIMPTILRLLHIPTPEHTEGTDLTPVFEGKSLDAERSIFSERPPYDEYSLRKGNWKYILRNPDKKTVYHSDVPPEVQQKIGDFFGDLLFADDTASDELYDLSKDSTEQHNLIGTGLPQEESLRKDVTIFREKMRNAREDNKTVPQADWRKLMPYP